MCHRVEPELLGELSAQEASSHPGGDGGPRVRTGASISPWRGRPPEPRWTEHGHGVQRSPLQNQRNPCGQKLVCSHERKNRDSGVRRRDAHLEWRAVQAGTLSSESADWPPSSEEAGGVLGTRTSKVNLHLVLWQRREPLLCHQPDAEFSALSASYKALVKWGS